MCTDANGKQATDHEQSPVVSMALKRKTSNHRVFLNVQRVARIGLLRLASCSLQLLGRRFLCIPMGVGNATRCDVVLRKSPGLSLYSVTKNGKSPPM